MNKTRNKKPEHDLLLSIMLPNHVSDDRIRELILDRRPGSEIRRAAKEDGMRFLRESALEKALGGMTTLREINRFTFVE